MTEKRALLSEMQHAVQNNLQTIVSILQLQAAHLVQTELIEQFDKAQNRVRAIAMLHESRYGSEDFSTIHFPSYLEELASHLVFHYDANRRIRLQLESADIALGIDQATPLGLIANELVSNALLHAFPEGRVGVVRVCLSYEADPSAEVADTLDSGYASLIVSTDGVAMGPEIDYERSDTAGFHIIRVLTKQLRGNLSLSEDRTTWALRFPLAEP